MIAQIGYTSNCEENGDTRLGHKTYILISRREVKNKGDIDEFNIEWEVREGFLRPTDSKRGAGTPFIGLGWPNSPLAQVKKERTVAQKLRTVLRAKG